MPNWREGRGQGRRPVSVEELEAALGFAPGATYDCGRAQARRNKHEHEKMRLRVLAEFGSAPVLGMLFGQVVQRDWRYVARTGPWI